MNTRETTALVSTVWEENRDLFNHNTGPSSGYDWGGDEQAQNNMEEYFWGSADRFAMLLSVLSQHLPTGSAVLDAGAGHGVLAAILNKGGYRAHACDIHPGLPIFDSLHIPYQPWHLEADPAPYADDHFDAVVLSQTIEHFTYSPRQAIQELIRIVRPGGLVLIDAPNISCFRNISRLLRGKTLHWDFATHYLAQKPALHHGIPYFDRHNHEYCLQDMTEIAQYFDLEVLDCRYYSSYNRKQKHWLAIHLSRIRDIIPHWRKGLFALFRTRS
ncbi:MAG: class I SAM-dependent methyltransferase [Mariprofundaceae bacterium]